MPKCECDPNEERNQRGVFVEIKGITTMAEQENIYKILKTSLQVIDEKTFKLAIIQQKEGMLYNARRLCNKHETLFERYGKVI